MFGFSKYPTKSKYYDHSNKLVIGKMKGERTGVAIKEFAALKSRIYSFLVHDSSEDKKAKSFNRNLLRQKVIMNTNVFSWIINVSEICWIEF